MASSLLSEDWLFGCALPEGAVVCEVRDHGRIADPLAGRRVPAPARPSGRGLWLANNLCDLMQIRLQDDGCVVRIRVCNR